MKRSERGLKALEMANRAFEQLPDDYLAGVSAASLKAAREALRANPYVALNVVSVTRRVWNQTSSAPSLTATLQSTAA